MVPVAIGYGIDPVHFGVIVIMTLMIGTLTPPMGMVLFVVAQSHNFPVHKLAIGVIPWLIPLVIVLLMMIVWPPIVTFLPQLFMGT